MGKITDIEPFEVTPLHGVTHKNLLRELVSSMKADGWTGRPILAVEAKDGAVLAWTGSHRIEAARLAKLQAIPCYVIRESTLLRATKGEISAAAGHVDDADRLAAIRRTRDERAITIMWSEGRT